MVCRFLPPKDDAAEGTEADRFELAAPEASKVTQYGLQHLRAAPSAQPAEAPQSADADWMAARRGMTRQDDAEKVDLSSFPQPTCMTQLHLPCFLSGWVQQGLQMVQNTSSMCGMVWHAVQSQPSAAHLETSPPSRAPGQPCCAGNLATCPADRQVLHHIRHQSGGQHRAAHVRTALT